MRFLSALVALSVLSLSVLPLGGCAAEPEGADPAADDDLRMTATGVSLDARDDGAVFAVQEGKKVVVNLSFGGAATDPYRAWAVTSTDRTFGFPKVTTKVPTLAGALTKQTFVWVAGAASPEGVAHRVTLTGLSATGRPDRTFSFTVRIVNYPVGAKRGAACGGPSAIMCSDGLDCKLMSASANASGTCRIRLEGRGVDEMCAGLAGVTCAEGLECKITESYPDADGVCVEAP